MRFVLTLVTGLGLFFAGARFVAPEFAGEVVELKTFDADGRAHETRLWIVERRGSLYLRSTRADAGWVQRIAADPRVELKRPGIDRGPFRAEIEPAQNAVVAEAMEARYGWANPLLFLAEDPAGAVAVRLDPPAVATPPEP